MAVVPRVITYEKWLDMPVVQDGVDEIARGEYRLIPPARYAHAETSADLIAWLTAR